MNNRIDRLLHLEIDIRAIVLPRRNTSSFVSPGFRRYLNTDPGFVTIQPGSYYSFPQYGDKGLVYVTIKIGLDLKDANFHVTNNRNVIVDSGGFLKNAARGEIWTDIGGVSHDKRWINQ